MGQLSVVQTSSGGLASKKAHKWRWCCVWHLTVCLFLIRHEARLTGFSVCPMRESEQTRETNHHTANHQDHCCLSAWSTVAARQDKEINPHRSNLLYSAMATTPSPKYQQLPHMHVYLWQPHSMNPVAFVVSTCCWHHFTVNRGHHFSINVHRGEWGQMTTVLRMYYIRRRFYIIHLQDSLNKVFVGWKLCQVISEHSRLKTDFKHPFQEPDT